LAGGDCALFVGVDDVARAQLGGDMEVTTSRFGKLQAAPSDILLFEEGLIGLRNCRRWVVLADAQNAALGWLQSIDDGDAALGVVSPRRFVPDYQLRVSRQELAPLGLATAEGAQVVVIVSRHAEGLSLNLRAPLVINVEARRGRQVIAKEPLPVQYALSTTAGLRRTA
jgi:flagellar assembly factor FliW